MRRASFSALFGIEIRLLLTSRFSWILGALLFGAMWWGAVNGQHQARAQQATIDRIALHVEGKLCLLYTSPSPRDRTRSRMPSSA